MTTDTLWCQLTHKAEFRRTSIYAKLRVSPLVGRKPRSAQNPYHVFWALRVNWQECDPREWATKEIHGSYNNPGAGELGHFEGKSTSNSTHVATDSPSREALGKIAA